MSNKPNRPRAAFSKLPRGDISRDCCQVVSQAMDPGGLHDFADTLVRPTKNALWPEFLQVGIGLPLRLIEPLRNRPQPQTARF